MGDGLLTFWKIMGDGLSTFWKMVGVVQKRGMVVLFVSAIKCLHLIISSPEYSGSKL
jgi:hypothetical protein